MVYANEVIEEQPRIDTVEGCRRCGGMVVWDEAHGWLHSDGWYACRQPAWRQAP